MSDDRHPTAEEIIRYDKDPATKIATITFDRPDHLNAPTADARLRYADLLHRAEIDDDVKVVVIRGVGSNFGSGADIPEAMEMEMDPTAAGRIRELRVDDADAINFPPPGSYRRGASITQWYANSAAGCRSLQDFKKISIVEAKGYCYGWHFYQAADADLVIASDDTLFGHPAFRYIGFGPRMWTWAQTMGIRKFQEMVFTGRPFTAQEMYDCNFANRVVPREELEVEVEKYALACARTRPTDTVFMQKIFFELMKQQQGEYMGSMITALFESLGGTAMPDAADLSLDEDTLSAGINNAVKSNDDQFPPDFRLSKSGRRRP
ncbi:enoyl-CoA hydratase/isomerase family protein [Gordonia sp. HNM0687]|uniref:Enoyl-CoA hydratase/isomerase family protein n=1 Tax=Gordonia mangrovi TaxID=2665643 RepID=A0A6L7GXF4_9ACTN|nr:enoyl-CoA hydratase/isomerase family protein [Gordonia mangrovi]MXP23315.1 enoyl-CoA hydratase/isomerase family protein [Gordonia mangrovi]UVF80762.1 enoyl-CoA hydratase/isomerase family protein [Gordonia mangrovi]